MFPSLTIFAGKLLSHPPPNEILSAKVKVKNEGGIDDGAVGPGIFARLRQNHEGGEEGQGVTGERVKRLEFGDRQEHEKQEHDGVQAIGHVEPPKDEIGGHGQQNHAEEVKPECEFALTRDAAEEHSLQGANQVCARDAGDLIPIFLIDCG